WDRSFYDPEKREYTVDKFLTETESRLGPIDAVLIWHVYPDLGVDDRNQFDLLRDLPGGIPGLRQMVQTFHRRGVKIFFPDITWEGAQYPFVPMVSKSKWLEPRHMVNVTDRFTRDKTDSLQHAFFNGQGFATLENLWGFWYGMTPHDAEAVLRLTRIERTFAENLRSPDWHPHVETLQSGVFATRFPTSASTLWTLVNRNEFAVEGEQLRLPYRSGQHFYDLWHGTELTNIKKDDGATGVPARPHILIT